MSPRVEVRAVRAEYGVLRRALLNTQSLDLTSLVHNAKRDGEHAKSLAPRGKLVSFLPRCSGHYKCAFYTPRFHWCHNVTLGFKAAMIPSLWALASIICP